MTDALGRLVLSRPTRLWSLAGYHPDAEEPAPPHSSRGAATAGVGPGTP
jgi:hypothetical protein